MLVNEWLKIAPPFNEDWRPMPGLNDGATTRKWAMCADGLTLSIQAGTAFWCEPRAVSGPYAAVEIACDAHVLPESFKSIGRLDDGKRIYGRVPVDTLDEILARHGGIVGTAPSLKSIKQRLETE